MTRANAEIQIASLTERDFLIVPDLGKIGASDFKMTVEAIESGRVAADAQRQQLARLSMAPADFQAHVAARQDPPEPGAIVDFVRIVNNSRVADEVLRARIRQRVGEPLDVAQLEADIGRLYGLELFQTIHYDYVVENGRSGIEITANERSWGPNYLQFGVALTNDFSGENRYNIGVSYLRTAINPRNGELRFSLQIGEDPLLGADWYQPLDYASNYFVQTRLAAQRRNVSVYDQKFDPFAEYRVTEYGAELSAGRNLGVLAELRAGLRRSTGDVDVRLGDPELPEFDFDRGAIYGRFLYDSIDNMNFPTSGAILLTEYTLFREALGSDDKLEQLRSRASYMKTFGSHTVGVGGRFYTTTSGDAAVQDRFRIGGFLNLSGLPQDALSGEHTAIAQAIYYRRAPLVPYFNWYAGASLELGNAWESGATSPSARRSSTAACSWASTPRSARCTSGMAWRRAARTRRSSTWARPSAPSETEPPARPSLAGPGRRAGSGDGGGLRLVEHGVMAHVLDHVPGQPVHQQREVGRRARRNVRPGRAHLLEPALQRATQTALHGSEQLAAARRGGLGLGDEGARQGVVQVDALQVRGHGGREPLRQRAVASELALGVVEVGRCQLAEAEQEAGLLVLEQLVEGRARDPGLGDDVGHRGGGIAFVRHDARDGEHQALALLVIDHGTRQAAGAAGQALRHRRAERWCGPLGRARRPRGPPTGARLRHPASPARRPGWSAR
jgi:hypothetical protein